MTGVSDVHLFQEPSSPISASKSDVSNWMQLAVGLQTDVNRYISRRPVKIQSVYYNQLLPPTPANFKPLLVSVHLIQESSSPKCASKSDVSNCKLIYYTNTTRWWTADGCEPKCNSRQPDLNAVCLRQSVPPSWTKTYNVNRRLDKSDLLHISLHISLL